MTNCPLAYNGTGSPDFARPLRSRAEAQIDSFLELEDGWHFGEGHAPSKETIRLAKKVVGLLRIFGCSRDRAFPGVFGDILVVMDRIDGEAEVLVRPSGAVRLDQFDGLDVDEPPFESIQALESFIRRATLEKVNPCRLSDSSTRDTGTKPRESFEAPHSGNLRMGLASRWSVSPVSGTSERPTAPIFGATTPRLQGFRPSSGTSLKKRLPAAA